jgi:hypothetical protein
MKSLLRSLIFGILLVAASQPGAEEPASTRSPSSDGATVDFANLNDGDVIPLNFLLKFSISGMGIAPAGVDIDNTGHHHLLVDLDELPDLAQPLPATEQILHFDKGQFETGLLLPEGEYRMQLLLADHAHVPHEPPVMSEVVVVRISADAPPQEFEE